MSTSLSENIFMIIFPNVRNEKKSLIYLGEFCPAVTCNGVTTKPIFKRLKICDHYFRLFNIQITILMKRALKVSQIFAKKPIFKEKSPVSIKLS